MKILSSFLLVSFFSLILLSSCDDDPAKEISKTSRQDMFCFGLDEVPDIDDDGIKAQFLTHKVALPSGLYTVNIKLSTEEDGSKVPLTNLEESSIVISDNNDLQFSAEAGINELGEDFTILSKPVSLEHNLMILIDVSGDVLDNLPEFKSALNSFIDAIFDEVSAEEEGQLQIGLYYFHGDPNIYTLNKFSSNELELKDAVRSLSSDLPVDKSSNLFGSVIESVNLLLNLSAKSSKESVSSTLVVFTDRKEHSNIKTQDELDSAIDSLGLVSPHSQIITIGLGGKIKTEELNNIGRDGYYFAQDMSNLKSEFSKISESVNSDLNSYYSINYCCGRRGGEAEINITINYKGQSTQISACLNANNIKDDCKEIQ